MKKKAESALVQPLGSSGRSLVPLYFYPPRPLSDFNTERFQKVVAPQMHQALMEQLNPR